MNNTEIINSLEQATENIKKMPTEEFVKICNSVDEGLTVLISKKIFNSKEDGYYKLKMVEQDTKIV